MSLALDNHFSEMTRSPDVQWLGQRIEESRTSNVQNAGIITMDGEIVALKCGFGPGLRYPNMASSVSVFFCASFDMSQNKLMNKEVGSGRGIPLTVFIKCQGTFDYGNVEVLSAYTEGSITGWILRRVAKKRKLEEKSGDVKLEGKSCVHSKRANTSLFKTVVCDGLQYDSVLEYKHHKFFASMGIVHSREPMTLHGMGGDSYSYTIDFSLENVSFSEEMGVQSEPGGLVYVEVKPAPLTFKERERCEIFCQKMRRPVLASYGTVFAHPLEDDSEYHNCIERAQRDVNIRTRQNTVRNSLCIYADNTITWHPDVYFASKPSNDGHMLSRLRSTLDSSRFDSVYYPSSKMDSVNASC